MTHAAQLIEVMRGQRWWTTGDLEALRISQCPWRRLSESGHRWLKPGEYIARKVGPDGLLRMRVERR